MQRDEFRKQQSQIVFPILFEESPIGMALGNANGQLILVNKAFEYFIGCTEEELKTKSYHNFTHPEDLAESEKHYRLMVSGECDHYQLEKRYIHKDGRILWGELNVSLVRNQKGEPAYTVGQVKDISKRKAIEDSLKEREEHYRLLYKKTPAMMHSIDKEGVIVSVSEMWLKKMGYERDEVIGHQSTDFLTEESRLYAKEIALPKFFEEREVEDLPYNFIKKNGEIMQTVLSATADYDDKGLFLRSLAVIIDVTDRNKLMAEQTRSAQLAALGTVVAGVAHEINNPIQGILNYATLLKKKPDNPDRTVEISERILLEGERIAEITKDLLYFSRDDNNKMVLSDICSLVEPAIGLIEKKTTHQGISIKTNCQENLPKTLLYPQRIQQVIINLIDNATDALLDKEMALTERVIKVSCYLKGIEDNQMIFLEVADRGVGMPEAVLKRAKETFFSTKPSSRGTGLGLSIVSDIVKCHNGEMTIESVEGEYTTVRIILPVAI